MRIIAFTDIHGAYDRIEKVLRHESPADAILIGGDLTTRGTLEEARAAIHQLQAFDIPLLAVAGNMDLPLFDAEYDRLGININAAGKIIDDVGFFGIAGSPFTPMNTPYEISEDEIKRRAEAGWAVVHGAGRTVFVPHAPPRGSRLDRIFTGRHVGSTSVRQFVEASQPDVLVCGHIHESRGKDALGRTQMVNCGAASHGHYAAIEIAENITIRLCG